MKSKILFRRSIVDTDGEFDVLWKYFKPQLITQRTEVEKGDLIIPRYSALPYYQELEKDVINLGGKLINTTSQFNYICNFYYYDDLKDLTFKTYFHPQELPNDKSFVVKGKTNSKKLDWNRSCFAIDRKRAIELFCELSNDSLIGSQGIIFREFEKLKTFEILINGLPVTNEHRFFIFNKNIASFGYYWANAANPELGYLEKEAFDLVNKVISIVGDKNNFYTVDIAQKDDESWIVVELNSGEMSGLSTNSPYSLYDQILPISDACKISKNTC